MNLANEEFDKYIEEAFDGLLEDIKARLHNVAILVEDYPTEEQLRKVKLNKDGVLFGLFEGFGQSRRLNFGPVLPDKITIFRKAILNNCNSKEEIKNQIINTLKHEIAHHFGSDETGARKASKNIK